MTLQQVRQFTLSLPETTEEPHFHLTSFRVRKKIFATAAVDGEYLHIFFPENEREAALNASPDFLEALFWGKRIVGVKTVLMNAKAETINQLLWLAWSSKAPNNLLSRPAPSKHSAGYFMSLHIARLILYVKDIPKVAAFYEEHFGLIPLPSSEHGWLELKSASDGCTIALHQAAKSQKSGSAIKIVFGILDVRGFVEERGRRGLKFGPIHEAEGFEYANAKDPAGNSISISSRGLKNKLY